MENLEKRCCSAVAIFHFSLRCASCCALFPHIPSHPRPSPSPQFGTFSQPIGRGLTARLRLIESKK
jgi:hypothetical protein